MICKTGNTKIERVFDFRIDTAMRIFWRDIWGDAVTIIKANKKQMQLKNAIEIFSRSTRIRIKRIKRIKKTGSCGCKKTSQIKLNVF